MKLLALVSFTTGWQICFAADLKYRCTPSTFKSTLPSNAELIYVLPYGDNSTFSTSSSSISGLPAFCAVYVNVTSSSSSAFEFGLWLPLNTWNGRSIAYGTGGFMGGVGFSSLAQGINLGFATVATNTGHNDTQGMGSPGGNGTFSIGTDGKWALNAPEKRTDWGWRAMHGSVSLGKKLAAAFYKKPVKYSYYSGCSTGGRQGLKALQMFPEDFDGVLAGAPAWWTTHLQQHNLKVSTYNLPNDAAHHIPQSLFTIIDNEIFRQCDGLDGLKDNIINNPYKCKFRPETLLCTSQQNSSSCLTNDQIGTVYKVYGDWVDTNQTFVFPALTLGSQLSGAMINSDEENPSGIAYARYFLYNDPDWTWQDLSYQTILDADRLNPGNATADDFDLRPFRNRGGKLIHYHGLADGSISAGASIYFYNQVYRTLRPNAVKLDDFYRLFMIPNMGHCGGSVRGDAPYYIGGSNMGSSSSSSSSSALVSVQDARHDALLALMAWVENGTAPDTIIATKFKNDDPSQGIARQRPLCPYPMEAKYVTGNPNITSSFKCGEI